ncbi:vWA domain-containing protein [Bacillus sp. 2205SS5-2]|uniref:vWA domain-containing protein n=1 Tax=Bacillus sp. 2205SS5-2 TaxID=3109031 RepID=UPI003004DBD0
MHRFIQFNDETINSFMVMELVDLAKTLIRSKNVDIQYGPHSYLDPKNSIIYISHFWDHRPIEEEMNGLKSDIYLRSIGSYKYSDFSAITMYVNKIKKTSIPSFAKQLFMLGEDIRLEQICIKQRKGTKRAFDIRREIYYKHFSTQLKTNLVKSLHTDALFNTLYLLLHADRVVDPPHISDRITLALPYIQRELQFFHETKSTGDVIGHCLKIIAVLEDLLDKDMLNEYFHLPEHEYTMEIDALSFDELKRKDKLKNDDTISSRDEETYEEKMDMWHRETSETGQSFLQFDIEQGSQTDILGDGVREGDEGDQALGAVQGSSQQTARNQYDQLEAVQQERTELSGGQAEPYGKENKYANPVYLNASRIEFEHKRAYDENLASVFTYQKKLQKMIEKTLEHKKVQPRSDLHVGRLGKKLLKYVTDENPRLFYKKNNPSTEIDAVFSLLVDCSASMYDKMKQTKLGITLFHEALKSVKVPHEIIGFWEDTDSATKMHQPNYFQECITFSTSLKRNSGPEIMQLEPQEDNRDGLAIRIMTQRLLPRHEQQKFLLVFSDGEPAALDYEQNGIIDTHEAVIEARKLGIEVLNVFLSNGEIDHAQKNTIQNIYGRYSILVSDVEELPDVLFPLLRKLLYRSI